MKRLIAIALFFFAAGFVTAAAPQKPADVFGKQLECATNKALTAYGQSASETNRVRRAVDSCMSSSLANEHGIMRVSGSPTLVALEERREDLVEAVLRRLQLCRDTGIDAAKFSNACRQLFSIERVGN